MWEWFNLSIVIWSVVLWNASSPRSGKAVNHPSKNSQLLSRRHRCAWDLCHGGRPVLHLLFRLHPFPTCQHIQDYGRRQLLYFILLFVCHLDVQFLLFSYLLRLTKKVVNDDGVYEAELVEGTAGRRLGNRRVMHNSAYLTLVGYTIQSKEF